MNILIVGKGGREHALAHHLGKDDRIKKIYLYPGNPGMSSTLKIELLSGDESELLSKLSTLQIKFAIIGPENMIVSGLGEKIEKLEIPVIAPSVKAAELESSKIFSKEVMKNAKIKTAKSFSAYNLLDAKNLANEFFVNKPFVVKLSGLHAGKGVYVGETFYDSMDKLLSWENLLTDGVLLEERLIGHEVSLFYLCNGDDAVYLGEACDHKRLLDGDQGPNTGGMGAFSPDPRLNDEMRDLIKRDFADATLKEMKKMGHPFFGVLFLGMMITNDGPYLIEYNVRFGDPETQTFLPRVESSLLDLFLMMIEKNEGFKDFKLTFTDEKSLHIVKAHGDYPNGPSASYPLEIKKSDPPFYFAGVKKIGERLHTDGGRVCGLTTLAPTFHEAARLCYENIENITFYGEQYRKDIAKDFR